MQKLSSFLDRIRLPLVIGCGLFLALSWASGLLKLGLDPAVLAMISIAFGSVHALRSAGQSIKSKELDVNLLMVIAGAGAIALKNYDDAAILLFLFSLSSYLEEAAMARTESAINALMKLRPESAILVTENGDEKISIEEIRVGHSLRVLPFERIPVDGLLITEQGSVDEGMMTGESIPIFKQAGDKVLSGSQNLDSMMLISATNEAKDSALQRIMDLVEEAQSQKATSAKITEWFGTRYAAMVIIAFILSILIRGMISRDWWLAFSQSLILLVALSPCAVVIASPAATLSALARAAKLGILVRNGGHLEEAGLINLVAMDKTGTITEGRPVVDSICAFDSVTHQEVWKWESDQELSLSAQNLVLLIASAESSSTHPIAVALTRFGKSIGTLQPVDKANVAAGLGIDAEIDGATIHIGQPSFFESLGEAIPGSVTDRLSSLKNEGKTIALARIRAAGQDDWIVVGLQDRPRDASKASIARLEKMGIEVHMLTGDNEGTAKHVADIVNIQSVHAKLSPGEKHDLIQGWVSQGKNVMMVGDGVNDAPSLSSSNLGVAMGGLGSEVAMKSADVILVQDKIEKIPELIELGRKTRQVIRMSLAFSVGVIVVLTVGSFFGKVPLPLAVVGHEGSTFLTMLNGLRLLGFKPTSFGGTNQA